MTLLSVCVCASPNVARQRLNQHIPRVTVRVTLRLAVYRQSVRLGAKPLRSTIRSIFMPLNPYGHSPCVTSSLTRRWVCLSWIGATFIKSTYCTYSKILKILPCALYTSPLSVQALESRSCLSYMSYAATASLVTWTVVGLTTSKFY
jgi:hypothetical protein